MQRAALSERHDVGVLDDRAPVGGGDGGEALRRKGGLDAARERGVRGAQGAAAGEGGLEPRDLALVAEPLDGKALTFLLLKVGAKQLGLVGGRRDVERSAAIELAATELLEEGGAPRAQEERSILGADG